jgi:hypothetical protein
MEAALYLLLVSLPLSCNINSAALYYSWSTDTICPGSAAKCPTPFGLFPFFLQGFLVIVPDKQPAHLGGVTWDGFLGSIPTSSIVLILWKDRWPNL